MARTIADILTELDNFGVFSYLFPFLIIFAITFAILQKTKLFGDSKEDGNKNVSGINAIIALSVGFLSLLNDFVRTFFTTIFPRFGVALAIFLVLLILIGFFYKPDAKGKSSSLSWIGWVLGIGVVLWAWSEWGYIFGGGFEIHNFLDNYFWGLIFLIGIGALIYWIVKGDSGGSKGGS